MMHYHTSYVRNHARRDAHGVFAAALHSSSKAKLIEISEEFPDAKFF